MSKKINWGLIGLGKMADVFISSLKEVPNSELKGIASKNFENSKRISNLLSIEKKFCFNDYSALIKCEEIEIVYITLPNHLHFSVAKDALENQKHVLVEKPACLKFQEVKVLEDLALTNNLLFAEGFSYLHNPITKELLEIVQSGTIGNILKISANIGFEIVPNFKLFRRFLDIFKKQHRLFNPKMGGGCILDLGCYTLSFLQLLTNLESIKIFDKNLYYGFKSVEIDAKIKIDINNNIKANLHSSFVERLDQKITIIGSQGDVTIENLWSGINTTLLVNNRNIEKSAQFQIPFSYQVNQINNCIIEENHIFENLPYSKFNSLNNIKLIELWRN